MVAERLKVVGGCLMPECLESSAQTVLNSITFTGSGL